MTRERKGVKLEVITGAGGQVSEIRFEKRSGTFFAHVGPDYVEGKVLSDVRSEVKSLLGKMGIIEWTPVIEVDVTDRDTYSFGRRDRTKEQRSASITLDIERYWLGLTPAGRIVKLDWRLGDERSSTAVAPEDRIDHSETFNGMGQRRYASPEDKSKRRKIVLPFHEGDHSYLTYTPELWATLVEIVERIDAQGDVLAKLVSTKEGIKALSERGTQALLPAKT